MLAIWSAVGLQRTEERERGDAGVDAASYVENLRSAHRKSGSPSAFRSPFGVPEIRRAVIQERVLSGLKDRLRELEARQHELTERLSAAPAADPDIYPNVAAIYRRTVARLAETLNHPEDRDARAFVIRGLIKHIVLTPGAK